jgi:Ni,Fe-hydrogenase I large subunit
MATTLSITKMQDKPLIPNVWRQFGVRLQRTGTAPATNVKVSWAITPSVVGNVVSLQYRDSADGEWKPLPLTGYFGPAAGFPITDGYDATTPFRVKVAAATAGSPTVAATYSAALAVVDAANVPLVPAVAAAGSFSVLASKYHEVDPISRIEGHMGVSLAVEGGFVKEAEVHGNLFRGFENFLVGREPNDAITYTQRICGVCPVPHGLTATYAADAVLGYSPGYLSFVHDGTVTGDGVPAKAVLIRNLVQACDMLMSSVTHFYHLAAQCYIQGPEMPPWTPFFDRSYYHRMLLNPGGPDATGVGGYQGSANPADHTGALPVKRSGFSDSLWSAVITQYVKALRIRRLIFEAGALFAGRMPMTSSFVAGGVTIKASDNLQTQCEKFADIMSAEVVPFIIKEYVPTALALGALYPAWDNKFNNSRAVGDPDVGTNWGFGAGLGEFLSWGGYPCLDDTVAFAGGHVEHPTASTFSVTKYLEGRGQHATAIARVKAGLTESIAHSRYVNYNGEFGDETQLAAYPGDVTRTQPDRDSGYSYMKAPRFDGKPREVGPLARLMVSGILKPNVGVVASIDEALGGAATATYVNQVGASVGLAPSAIEADLAVALVREGLATLNVNNGALIVSSANIEANIGDVGGVYNDTNSVIQGTILNHVLGLKSGLSVMDRIRARAIESLYLALLVTALPTGGTISTAGGWINQLKDLGGRVNPSAHLKATCRQLATPPGVAAGFGCNEAPRGSLAHFSTINKGKITAYQCVVPYTWNGSPKDISGQRGPTEAAMIGIPYQAATSDVTWRSGNVIASVNGVEALRVAQSFDPCIACAVH